MEPTSPRPHWRGKAVCVICGRQLDQFPLYHCPRKHPCCQNCFKELTFVSKDNNLQMTHCPLCKIIGPSPTNPLDHSKSRPGIGRPYRYNVNSAPITTYNYSKNYQDFCTPSTSATTTQDEEKMFETLIGMTKEKFYRSSAKCKNLCENSLEKPHSPKSKFSLPPATSKRPFRCPHKPCHKTVALAQFVNHFKSEHRDVPVCAVERGKELLLSCDISLIEYNFHYCLAMITVYEINRVDYLKSGGGSSESIIRTCNKFCQKVPINTFWLMVTGIAERRLSSSYCIFWLFTNSEEKYKCTLELGSKEDSMCLSTYCGVWSALDKDFSNVQNKLQCLIITKSSLKSILKEGVTLNLRVTIH